MNLNKWNGKWENFENYIDNDDEHILKCWKNAEENCQVIPMFRNGVKNFWKKACFTTTKDNSVSIDTWLVEASGDGLDITWTLKDGSIWSNHYMWESTVEKGLENKESYLFVSDSKDTPFTFLLVMEPMPDKTKGGILSHLHFQYGKTLDELVQENKLVNPMWYATMVDEEGSLLQKCNLLNAMHHLPILEKLD